VSYLLGIDVGTTGTRAVLVNEAGQVVAGATAEHLPMATPKPGWAEQDPADWWRATVQAVRQVLEAADVAGENIRGIGLSGQMHGVVLLDAGGEVLRPSIIWCDQRSQSQCDWITEHVGRERLIELTCNPALTGFSAPKLLWIREHEPGTYDKVRHLLLPKDYVRFRLTGEFATEVSDASGTLLFDVRSRSWSQEMLRLLEIDPMILPAAHESPVVSARVSREAARETGLSAGTPVVGGGGDQAAGGVGNGIVKAGIVSSTIGTSGVVFAFSEEPVLDPKGRVHTFCHAVPGKWLVMGVTQGAGLSLRWFRDNFGQIETQAATLSGSDVYDLLVDEAAGVQPGSEGLLYLPYLMGERTPHLDANARGVFFGLTARHNRCHVIRSILEGVAYSLRDALEILREMGIPLAQIRASGGGGKSALWRQIQADVFGVEVVAATAGEGPAYGAALLAGVGTEVWDNVETACEAGIREVQMHEPEPHHVRQYETYYSIYRQLYPTLKPWFDALAQPMSGSAPLSLGFGATDWQE